MPTLNRLKTLVHEPLIHLAGGPISLGSLLFGLLTVVVSYFLAWVASRGVSRLLTRHEVAHGARFALTKFTRYLIVLIGTVSALMTIGVRLDALMTALTVVLVGVGFGLQNIAQNFVSGMVLLMERPVATGDFVQVGQAVGSVVNIGMRATRLLTRDATTIIVPNSELITTQVINHSVPMARSRIAIRVGVPRGADAARVREALLAVARADTELLAEPSPDVRFDDFGDSSLVFSLLVWIADPREDIQTASRLRFAIDTALRGAGHEAVAGVAHG